jgi:hypothetical protein
MHFPPEVELKACMTEQALADLSHSMLGFGMTQSAGISGMQGVRQFAEINLYDM